MPPTFVGYGVEDYSAFGAGAPVLIVTGPGAEAAPVEGHPFAGRLAEPFRPGAALLLRDGPLAATVDVRRATRIHHWITERRFVREPPVAFQLALGDADGVRWVVVMRDEKGIVEEIERRGSYLRWPEHLVFAQRIVAFMNDAAATHREHLKSLLFR